MLIKPRERDAIVKSLAAGVVPTIGLHHIQVDRKDEIMAMIGDLERIKEGGASFRLVIGRYGTGKSFFLNLTKSVALAEKFVVMQADVTQKRRLTSTTGYARDLYAALLGSMSTKARPEGGAVDIVLDNWIVSLREKYGEDFDEKAAMRGELKRLQDMVGGYHFTQAVTKYCEARQAGAEDKLRSSKKWLTGGYDKLTAAKGEIAIDSYIGDKDIYDYLRLWGEFVRIAGFSGLLILLDEMGVLVQALTNNAARTGNYEIILQILNDCLQGRASGVGFLLAGADYLLDDRKNGLMSHGALASRLAPNPFARDGLKDLSTPIIRLGEFSPEDLYLLFENIRDIFAMEDKSKYLIPDEAIRSFMDLCAWSLGPEFYKTPRDAVKLFTGFLSVLEQNSQVGWQKLLDGTIIERVKNESASSSRPDDEYFSPPLLAGADENGDTEIPAAEIHDEEPQKEEALPEIPLILELELEPEHSTPEIDDAPPYIEPEPIPEAEPEPEAEFGPEDEEMTPGKLEQAELVPGPDSGAEESGFDAGPAEPDEIRDTQPEFDLVTGPGSYVNESGTPEEDMREGRVIYGNENDLRIYLPNLISRNPLIGMEVIPVGIHNDLVRMSRKLLINAHRSYLPNGYEKMLLTVALISIAKRFPSDDEEAFWNFLSRQLGFESDAGETIRGTMCGAIYETMRSHHRFFCQEDKTNKRDFYSTIMVHALSSGGSLFSWFDFLMDFYRDNLRGAVIGNDPAVAGMTEVLRGMFEDVSDRRGVVLKGRQFAVRTGIITLLMQRPVYFKKLTREILERMERLVSGGRLEDGAYLDELLTCWFEKKQPQRIERAEAAAYYAIRPRYEIEGSNSVVLVIPSIRIRERISGCPEAVADIRCGDDRLREDLNVYGDEFAWTVSETRIPVSRISDLAFARDLRIRVKILVEGRIIYDSRASLYRDMIIFSGEREIPPRDVREGLYRVFAAYDAEIIFDTTADDRVIPTATGQIRAVKFGGGFCVTLNGRIVCSDYRNEDSRIAASSEPNPGLSFVLRGEVYDVWTGGFDVTARIPLGRDLRRYSFKVGDVYYPLDHCDMQVDGGVIVCMLFVKADMIKDNLLDVALVERGIHDRELCRRGFCVMNGLNVLFDKPYYFGNMSGGTVRIESGAERAELGLSEDGYVSLPVGEGYIRVKAPVISWRLEPHAEGTVWREDIPAGCKMMVACPDGTSCKLKIGGSEVTGERQGGEAVFAVGAALCSEEFGRKEDIVHVELILGSAEDSSSHVLFSVCRRETFREAPKFEIRDGSVILKNPWAFSGSRATTLEYSFKGRADGSFIAAAGEPVISENCNLPHGRYDYSVSSLPDIGSMRAERVIYSGSCVLGDADVFRFDNRLLEIRRVRSGFMEFFILPVYLENLKFEEVGSLYDDNVSYPVYSGMCYYINRNDEKIYFGEDFNPVRAVIINGREICLYKRDGEKPYLIYESRHKLVPFKPDGDSGITWHIPDFYEYEALDGN